MAQNDKTIEIEVARYRPEQDWQPFVQTYRQTRQRHDRLPTLALFGASVPAVGFRSEVQQRCDASAAASGSPREMS